MWYNTGNRGLKGIDMGLEIMVQAKRTTNKLETLFAHAKAWLVNLADGFLAGLRPVSALATA